MKANEKADLAFQVSAMHLNAIRGIEIPAYPKGTFEDEVRCSAYGKDRPALSFSIARSDLALLASARMAQELVKVNFNSSCLPSFQAILKEFELRPARSGADLVSSASSLGFQVINASELIDLELPIKFSNISKIKAGAFQSVSKSIRVRLPSSELVSQLELEVDRLLNPSKRSLRVNELILPLGWALHSKDKNLVICKLRLTSKERKTLHEQWLARQGNQS